SVAGAGSVSSSELTTRRDGGASGRIAALAGTSSLCNARHSSLNMRSNPPELHRTDGNGREERSRRPAYGLRGRGDRCSSPSRRGRLVIALFVLAGRRRRKRIFLPYLLMLPGPGNDRFHTPRTPPAPS